MVVHAVAALVIKDRKLLVAKEFNEKEYHTPGGTINFSETPEEALKRELIEETGVQLLSMEPFVKINGKTFDGDNLLLETFLVEIKGMPKPSSEIESLQWIDKDYQNDGVKLTIPAEKQLLKLIETNLIE